MMQWVKKQWRALRESRPGERFEDRYRAANRSEKGGRLAGHVVRVALAIVAFAIGVVLTIFPGPAVVFFALAGALMATESRWVAQLLDWTELKLRAIGRALWERWCALTLAGKIAAGVVLTGLASSAAYGAFQIMAD